MLCLEEYSLEFSQNLSIITVFDYYILAVAFHYTQNCLKDDKQGSPYLFAHFVIVSLPMSSCLPSTRR